MKKIFDKLKNNSLVAFILGIILCGGVVYGSSAYESNNIKYTPTDTSWGVSNVNDAINSLYSMKKELDTTKTSLNNLKGIGDATAAQILNGKKAVVKGSAVTGTMKNMSNSWIWTGNGIEEYTYSNGTKANMVYVRSRDDWGDGYITTNSKFIVGTENDLKKSLLSGKTLLGVTGTATSDATATAADILSGKTAYVNGTKITGTAQTDIYNMNNVLKFLSEVGFKSHSTIGTSTPVVLIPVGGSASVTTTSSAGYGECRIGSADGAHKGSSWGNYYTEYGLGASTKIFETNYSTGSCSRLNGTITGKSKGVGIASFGFRGTSNSYWEMGYYLVIVY